jgi:hypothetical protein
MERIAMPKIIGTDQIEKFLATIAGGDSQGVAAKQFGFTSGTVSIWAKRRPEFAERLRAAHEQGKVARRRQMMANTRAMFAALAGGPPATAAELLPQGEATEPAAASPAPEQRPTFKPVPLGKLVDGILYVDMGMLSAALASAMGTRAAT